MLPPELDVEDLNTRRFHARSNVLAIVSANLIHLAVAAQVWPDWKKVAIVVAGMIGLGAFNASVPLIYKKLGHAKSEWLRMPPNIVACVAIGAYLDWPIALWLFVPFFSVFHDSHKESGSHFRLALSIIGWDIGALMTGADWPIVLAFTSLSVMCAVLTAIRQLMVRGILEDRARTIAELSRTKLELEAAHHSAVVNEKLAGIGLLAAGIAHEINNPMSYVTSNIRGLIEDMRADAALSPSMHEYRDEILEDTLQGISRVNTIVADLRRFASGEVEKPAPFNVNTELTAAVRIASLQLRPSQRIVTDLKTVPQVDGNGRQLGQVALNLIVNAIQAIDQNGEVKISSRTADDGGVVITVSDDGAGIPEKVRSHIFEPFFTTKRQGTGTGLGLSVAHGIIASHKGRIDVDSEVDRGTAFTIWLPAMPAPTLALAA